MEVLYIVTAHRSGWFKRQYATKNKPLRIPAEYLLLMESEGIVGELSELLNIRGDDDTMLIGNKIDLIEQVPTLDLADFIVTEDVLTYMDSRIQNIIRELLDGVGLNAYFRRKVHESDRPERRVISDMLAFI